MREIVNQSQYQKIPALPCMKFTFPKKLYEAMNSSEFDFIYREVLWFWKIPTK